MFILELTLRSWNHSEENKRRTLQRNDIAAAITRTDIFDFLARPCPALRPAPFALSCRDAQERDADRRSL
jgi:nuclear transcription factor Y gamma